jgi:superfamily II DNA or RNA helicase
MLAEIVNRAHSAGASILAVAHRDTITKQLHDYFQGKANVITIQSVLNYLDLVDPPNLLILDECHHYAAPEWKRILNIGCTKVIGATATPVRADGKPLGNAFDKLVVAADYPELIEHGYLVPLDIVGPGKCISPDLSMHPVKAYLKHTDRGKAFVFTRTIEEAKKLCMEFEQEGVGAGLITAETPRELRSAVLAGFAETVYDVIVNVFTMTEGVDIPRADTVILARGCSHMSPFLQMCGRVLRPYRGKRRALLIDLPGISRLWGDPTAAHKYSLERGIELEKPISVFECPACMYADENRFLECPQCGHELDKKIAKKPKIYDMQLAKVYAGSNTPDDAKVRELNRLLWLNEQKGFTFFWVSNQYRKVFGERPDLSRASERAKRNEFRLWRRKGTESGYKSGWAAFRYKETFGAWPPKSWKDDD